MHFDKTSFGSITISGKRYNHDVYLYNGGTAIKKRDKSKSKRIHGHKELAKWELKQLIKEDPDYLIIGMGQSGVLPIERSTRDWLNQIVDDKNINLIQRNTPDLLEETNELLEKNKKVVGVFHTTC